MFHEISTEFSQTFIPSNNGAVIPVIKGTARSFGEEIQAYSFDFYNINEIKIPTLIFSMNKVFSVEKKAPRTLLAARKVAGSATDKHSK